MDLQIEPQVEISQVRLQGQTRRGRTLWTRSGDIAGLLETAYKGRVVSQVLDEDRYFGLVVWYDEARGATQMSINETILETPSGRQVALGEVVDVLDTTGPEHAQSGTRSAADCRLLQCTRARP